MRGNMSGNEEEKTLAELRYELALERLRQIPWEEEVAEAFRPFFAAAANWLLLMDAESLFLRRLQAGEEEESALYAHNHALYADILPGHYECSFANPAYASCVLGREPGPLMAALFYELRGCIPFVYRGEPERLLIRMELLLEIYTAFAVAYREEGGTPAYGAIREIMSLYLCDYAEEEERRRLEGLCDPEKACTIPAGGAGIRDSRFSRCLFGEYSPEEEPAPAAGDSAAGEQEAAARALLRWHRKMEEAGASAEDFRFVTMTASAGALGAAHAAAEALREEGLKGILPLREQTLFVSAGTGNYGYRGAVPNLQYVSDHREDLALFMDPLFLNRKLEGIREAREELRGLLEACAPVPLEVETGAEEAEKERCVLPPKAAQAPSYTAKMRRMAAELEAAAALTGQEFAV